MSAPTTIEDDFSKLFSDPSKIVFCAYMNLGLLCLDNTNNKLTLVSAVASTAGQSQVVFGKISTISLCPSPPTTAEFQIIVPNKNGSKLALVGLRMVVVVDMNESFWMSASLLSPENVSELQSEYFSKCQILHMSLVVSNSAPAVVKVNWYMNLNHHAISGRSISIVRSNLLAVLFSDNIIRFYDVKNCLEKALFFVDFGQLLPDEPDTEDKLFHSGHAMGLIPQIVSFDFGPTVSSDGNDFATVFAMDSDGELYFAAFNWTDLKCFLPSGPLIIANNNSSSKFVCAASDLLFVRHALSSTIPVFSMSSSEGVISHLVLVQSQSSNFLASNGKNVFELFVFDSLQMDNWSSSSFCLSLQNDSSDRATYFAVNSNNLYVVDANAWVTDVSTRISSEGQNVMAKKLSIVHHIFLFLDPDTLDKENLRARKTTSSHTLQGSPSQPNSIQSVASINMSGKIDLTFENDLKARSQGGTDDLELFVALTTKGNMMASFVRHQVSTTKDKISSEKDKFTNSQLQFFEKVQAKRLPGQGVPNIKFNGLSRLEELKVGLNTLSIMSKNVENRNSAIDFATDDSKKIVSGYLHLEKTRTGCNEKLAGIFKEITETKAVVATKRRSFKQLDERIKKIALKLQPLLFPAVEDEIETSSALINWQKKIKEYQMQLNEINMRVLAHRKKVLGPSKPFRASASAQKFMLTKNDTEVMQLKNCLENLLNEADKFDR